MLRSTSFILFVVACTQGLQHDVPDSTPEVGIIGGTEATPHEAPYIASLYIKSSGFNSRCAGTLVSRRYVLTAKHCLLNPRLQYIDVILGAHNVEDEAEDTRLVIPNLKQNSFILHPDRTYDVALIDLKTYIPESAYIKYAKLPSKQDVNNTYKGERPTVYGWGRTSDKKGSQASTLRKVDTLVIGNGEWPIADQEMATRDSRSSTVKTTCSGDSGGPLILDGVQIGVTSRSIKPCSVNNPSIFVRTTRILKWLEGYGINIRP